MSAIREECQGHCMSDKMVAVQTATTRSRITQDTRRRPRDAGGQLNPAYAGVRGGNTPTTSTSECARPLFVCALIYSILVATVWWTG